MNYSYLFIVCNRKERYIYFKSIFHVHLSLYILLYLIVYLFVNLRQLSQSKISHEWRKILSNSNASYSIKQRSQFDYVYSVKYQLCVSHITFASER